MDIHRPKPWHGLRELAKEIGVIVIGVLIALAGEQIVEWLHRGEQARRAEDAMRLELGDDNGPQAYGRALIGPCLDDRLTRIRDASTAAPAAKLRELAASYVPPVRTWDSEAWKVVVSSEAGNFLGAARLVDWSAAYRMVPPLNDTNQREAALATELRDALPTSGDISATDRQNLRRLAAQLRFANNFITRGSELFLVRTHRLGAEVPAATQGSLQTQARALYGPCVTLPDPTAPAPAQNPVANLRGFAGWPTSAGSPQPPR